MWDSLKKCKCKPVKKGNSYVIPAMNMAGVGLAPNEVSARVYKVVKAGNISDGKVKYYVNTV
jgi:hypothetical protein